MPIPVNSSLGLLLATEHLSFSKLLKDFWKNLISPRHVPLSIFLLNKYWSSCFQDTSLHTWPSLGNRKLRLYRITVAGFWVVWAGEMEACFHQFQGCKSHCVLQRTFNSRAPQSLSFWVSQQKETKHHIILLGMSISHWIRPFSFVSCRMHRFYLSSDLRRIWRNSQWTTVHIKGSLWNGDQGLLLPMAADCLWELQNLKSR